MTSDIGNTWGRCSDVRLLAEQRQQTSGTLGEGVVTPEAERDNSDIGNTWGGCSDVREVTERDSTSGTPGEGVKTSEE